MSVTQNHRPRLRALGAALALTAALLGGPAAADDILTVTITQGVESALPVAVVPFESTATTADGLELSRTLQEVIASDLNRSGRLKVPAVASYPQQPGDFQAVDFPAWQAQGMQSLVIGRLSPADAGSYSLEFRLVDVFGSEQVLAYRVPTTLRGARRTGHQLADLVYEALTGQPGVFSTRVAYVSVDTRPGAAGEEPIRRYKLNVADSDGANPQQLFESSEPILSPAWTPDGSALAYTSLANSKATLYIQDLRSGQREVIPTGQGLASSPAFSPDGSRVALTISRDGNPDIYLYARRSGSLTRLTTSPAIDTEAAFSPDGRTIAFTSDRGGAPQIYTMALLDPRPKRLTYNMGSYNARPRYAPDGKSMTLVTRGAGNGFRIGLLDLERSLLTTLSSGDLDESPSFAPNGQLIIYSKRAARGTELAVVSADGRVQQRLSTAAGEVREPAWGPLSP